VTHENLRVFNTILYENEFQNPQIEWPITFGAAIVFGYIKVHMGLLYYYKKKFATAQ
jgi:hypothetical protein